MTLLSSAAPMDPQTWTGKIFNGNWVAPMGGEYQVV